ncbi:MAG: hypothetical protein OEZ58_08405 [Gammaproteobacteria bacterium]|nr:hypothetical protein [Gammaproteobacteria bacterium]MDH5728997.1 hypothetical protein [Gammaproteobacteria bacterium]
MAKKNQDSELELSEIESIAEDLSDIGDIDGSISQIDPDSEKSLGDLSSINDDELIGDLSLLDEAIAELDGGQENSTDSQPDISSITETSSASHIESGLSLADDEESALMAPPSPSESSLTSNVNDSEDDVPTLSEDAIVGQMPSRQTEAASQMDSSYESELELAGDSQNTAKHESQLSDIASTLSEISNSTQDNSSELTQNASQLEQTNAKPSSTRRSESGDGFSALLHAQIANKIDALVMDAIHSVSNELNHKMALKLEVMIMNAIDKALPAIMSNISNELRNELEKQIRADLPSIVNELVGEMSEAESE